MRHIYIMLFMLVCLPTFADNIRIAVFDPTSNGTSIDEGTKMAIREIISSTIVNAGNYDIVERSLLEKVMQEQSFSNSGAVDDNDATEIGKLAGANKIVLSVVTLTGGRNMLSVKIIDVKTANVERQRVKVVASGELLDVVEPLTLSLIDAAANDNEKATVIVASRETIKGDGTKVLKQGMPIPLQVLTPVRAAAVKKGQNVPFKVSRDIVIDGVTVIPYGTIVNGTVYKSRKSLVFGVQGCLGLNIKEIVTSNGNVVPLTNGNVYVKGKNRTALSLVVFIFTFLPLPCGTRAELPYGFEVVANVASDVVF